MIENHPSKYVSQFTDERLTMIAKALKEQADETDQDLQSTYDSGYSKGCTRFDRQKNRLLALAAEQRSWLGIKDGSNRLILDIKGAPFRITVDDHTNPKKPAGKGMSRAEAVLLGDLYDNQMLLQLEPPQQSLNLKWRFFTELTENIEDGTTDFDVLFVGLDEYNAVHCVWKLSENSVNTISSITEHKVQAVKKPQAKTILPDRRDEQMNSDE